MSSHSRDPQSSKLGFEFDNLSDQFHDMLMSSEENKPDFREFNFVNSPVSPFMQSRRSTSSSSSFAGSISAKRSYHSGDLYGSSEYSSPTASRSIGSPMNSKPAAKIVLPAGNICPSGNIIVNTGMGSNRTAKTEVLGNGGGNYGHGSIMRGRGGGGGSVMKAAASLDLEELKRGGNEQYKRGKFGEALSLYDRAIALCPGDAAIRRNRAAALTALGRLDEAVMECEEALRLDANYGRVQQILAYLYLRLGQVENAKKYLFCQRQQPDPSVLQKLESMENHISKCTNARRLGDWKTVLSEIDAAIDAGADSSLQLFICKAEALFKLHQIDEAASVLLNISKTESVLSKSSSQEKLFGMLPEAYFHYVRAQVDMALGRFESAVKGGEKASRIDPQNIEVHVLRTNIRIVSRARARGNDLFYSERFTEARSAYDEGLKRDPSNSVLYCNRAACFFKLGLWDRSIEDCNRALQIQPNYTKALLRRAASNDKLEKWEEAIKDYEVLRRILPDNNDISEALFHAHVALKKPREEEVSNLKFGGEVEVISGLEQFRAALSLPGLSVVYYAIKSHSQCKLISPFVKKLCRRYPSISFLKVDIHENPEVATAENIKIVPTFQIYKNEIRMMELVFPSHDMLEYSLKHYHL